jgi:hypothetical protein
MATSSLSWQASGATVDFISPGVTVLPYAESGLTFFTMPGSTSAVVANGRLTSGTNFVPIHIRATGIQPFDLTSLNIATLYRAWRIESSSGAVLPLLGPGTIDFSGQPGWSSIVYFDFVHNPAEPNGSVSIDSLEFQVGQNSLPGDYNVDETVNAADYVVWREKIRTSTAFTAWRGNFGSSPSAIGGGTSIPEPATALLVGISAAAITLHRCRFRRWLQRCCLTCFL